MWHIIICALTALYAALCIATLISGYLKAKNYIFAEVMSVISQITGIEVAQISLGDRLIEDMYFNDSAFWALTLILSDAFDTDVSRYEMNNLRTVQDIIDFYTDKADL